MPVVLHGRQGPALDCTTSTDEAFDYAYTIPANTRRLNSVEPEDPSAYHRSIGSDEHRDARIFVGHSQPSFLIRQGVILANDPDLWLVRNIDVEVGKWPVYYCEAVSAQLTIRIMRNRRRSPDEIRAAIQWGDAILYRAKVKDAEHITFSPTETTSSWLAARR